MRLARVLGGAGRAMISAGVLILLFVAYQLWGTGIQAARAQNALDTTFDEQLEENLAAGGAPVTDTGGEPAEGPGPVIPDIPEVGQLTGRIEIPAIGVDWKFLEGVGLDVLKDGPGHYSGTPLPGQDGNAAIAGHRTTYGQPFHNVDKLASGDRIKISYITGAVAEYEYRTTEIVRPDQIEVLDDFDDNRLTLTACHPKYSAAERIVVTAVLIDAPIPGPDRPVRDQQSQISFVETSLDGEQASKVPALLWGLAAGSIWLAAWFVGRVWRRWPTYLTGLPFFLAALFVFFENFARLLPAGY